jgi:hypothetical protein
VSDIVYLLWSNKHGMWWRPDERGYTPNIDEAGRYGEAHAVRCVVRSANHGDLSKVTAMVAAPDNWEPPPPVGARVIAGPGPLSSVLSEALTKLAAERVCLGCGRPRQRGADEPADRRAEADE